MVETKCTGDQMYFGIKNTREQMYLGAKRLSEQMCLGAKYPREQTSQGAKCGGVKQTVLNMQEIKQVIVSTKL